MYFKVKIRNHGEPDPTKFRIDETNAENENQMRMIYEATGQDVLEILQVVEQNNDHLVAPAGPQQQPQINPALLPKPNLDGLRELGISEAPLPPNQFPHQQQQQLQPAPPAEKIFTDGGIEYKVVFCAAGDEVYKKDWIECNMKNYKVVKVTQKARKDITEEVIVMKRDWIKLAD